MRFIVSTNKGQEPLDNCKYVFLHGRVCQDEASNDSNESVNMQQWIWRLQSPTKLMELLFMYDFSIILSYTSKQCQDPSHLPPTRKIEITKLIKRLKAARDSFRNNQCPAVVTLLSYLKKVTKVTMFFHYCSLSFSHYVILHN